MSDRALLELAALAAGYEVEWFPSKVWDGFRDGYFEASDGSGDFAIGDLMWNPLTDDGDTLRLAAHLNMQIHFGKREAMWVCGDKWLSVRWDGDDYKRGITSLAAEIGKAMQARQQAGRG